MNLYSYKQDQGFTLVEVMVALTVLSIVTAAFVQLYSSNTKAIITHGQRSEALFEAQSMVEAAIAAGGADGSDVVSIRFSLAGGDEFIIEVPGETVTEGGPGAVSKGKAPSITAFIPSAKN